VALLVLALRGAAAIALLTTLVGGIPRVVQVGLAVVLGLWAALIAGASAGDASLWLVGARELVIGATLGLVAAVPLVIAQTAGRLVDLAAQARGPDAPYRTLFGVLGAAVFVGIDGHVTVLTAIVDSYRAVPAAAADQPHALAALAALIPGAVRLAMPWLVTAAVVQLAVGAGMRVAGKTGLHVPVGAATPAALVMITASLIATLAVAMAAMIRGAVL
jgi:flagellar biosynthesis protein FliR